jgi:hypothetical protein
MENMAHYYDSWMWSHVPWRWWQVMSRTSSRRHYYRSFTKLQLKCPIAILRFIQKPFSYILPAMYAWVDFDTCFISVLEDGICLSTTPQGLTSHNTNFKNKDLTICKFWGFHTAVVLWDMTLYQSMSGSGHYEGSCCFHLKCQEPLIQRCRVTSQNTRMLIS